MNELELSIKRGVLAKLQIRHLSIGSSGSTFDFSLYMVAGWREKPNPAIFTALQPFQRPARIWLETSSTEYRYPWLDPEDCPAGFTTARIELQSKAPRQNLHYEDLRYELVLPDERPALLVSYIRRWSGELGVAPETSDIVSRPASLSDLQTFRHFLSGNHLALRSRLRPRYIRK